MEYTNGKTVFGDWKIGRKLGEGASGKVFELEKSSPKFTTKSALKVIRIPPNPSDLDLVKSGGMDEAAAISYFQSFVDEILNEIAILSRLKSHPNIVRYEDHCVIRHVGSVGWDILIRMELLMPVFDYQKIHVMDEAEVCKLGRELCEALVFCQSHHLIHRDIKPQNTFIDPMGHFKLGDFGIARTIEKTSLGLSKKGTESYMAPEVYLNQPYNSTVDIYSLGLMLYQLMNNNRMPFLPANGPITYLDWEEAIKQRMSGKKLSPPVNASPQFAKIILKACDFTPQNRYATAREMLDALNQLQPSAGSFSSSQTTSEKPKDQTAAFSQEADDRTIPFSEQPSFHKGASNAWDTPPKGKKQAGPSKKTAARNQSSRQNRKTTKWGWILAALVFAAIAVSAANFLFSKVRTLTSDYKETLSEAQEQAPASLPDLYTSLNQFDGTVENVNYYTSSFEDLEKFFEDKGLVSGGISLEEDGIRLHMFDSRFQEDGDALVSIYENAESGSRYISIKNWVKTSIFKSGPFKDGSDTVDQDDLLNTLLPACGGVWEFIRFGQSQEILYEAFGITDDVENAEEGKYRDTVGEWTGDLDIDYTVEVSGDWMYFSTSENHDQYSFWMDKDGLKEMTIHTPGGYLW